MITPREHVCGTDLSCGHDLLFVRHTDDSQHQVDEVVRPEEDDHDEEEDVPRTVGAYHLQVRASAMSGCVR